MPARRSAWWLGRHAPVQRPRGAFCDSASAPEVEKSGRTVSAIPMYGSHRTLGFPPRRNHLATGGPSRRPPTAGCADQRSAFPCLRVAPPGEKSGRTVSAIPMYGSRRTLGFPPRRNHVATGGPSRRPPSAGCADQRSAFPCLRVAPPGEKSGTNGVCHSNVRITPNAGIPAEKEPPRNWGSFPPPAFGGLCRPEVGVPLPARRSAWWHGRHAPVQRSRGAFCDSASAPEV